MMLKKFIHSFTLPLLAVLLGLAMLSACSPGPTTKTTPGKSLGETHWQLTTLAGQAVSSKRPLTLDFDGNRMSGYAGCNRFFGSYTSNTDGAFSTGPIGATTMACGGEQDQLENRYLQALGNATQFAVIRGKLHLLDANRNILMVLLRATAPDNKSIGLTH